MVALITIIFAPFSATIIKLAISRTREFAADAGAVSLTGKPRALASALERLSVSANRTSFSGNTAFASLFIVNSFSGDFLGNLFSTHPSTDARICELLNLQGEVKQRQQKFSKIQLHLIVKRGLIIITTTIVVFIPRLGWANNSLNNAAITVDAKWAQVENQMQRRANLIPNLTNITVSNTEQNSDVMLPLNQARQAYLQAIYPEDKVAADTSMSQAIQQFIASATTDSQLQSNQLFIDLQYEITGTENRIATERRRYNQAVKNYNESLNNFPTILIARHLGFKSKPFLYATNTKKIN